MMLLARDAQPAVLLGLLVLGVASAVLLAVSVLLDLADEALEAL